MPLWRVRRLPPRTLTEFKTRLYRACQDDWFSSDSEDEEILVLRASFDAAVTEHDLMATISIDDLSRFIVDMTVHFVQSPYSSRYTVFEQKVLKEMLERRLRRFAGLQYAHIT